MSTAVNNTAINNAVNNYTYNYQGKFQPKLDKNDDAVWNREELQSYADAFNKATGQKLDVDKLMEKYANEDGVIDYKAQQTMQSDDALGFSVLQGAANTASSSSSSSGSTTTTSNTGSNASSITRSQKDAVLSAVNQYTYDYSGKFQPLLDKNDDGMWNRQELTEYADAYHKATGNKLNVDALIEKYGNEDGNIDPKNQAAMKENDALGLSALKSAYNEAMATTVKEPTNNKAVYWDDLKKANATAGDYSMEDLLSTMSPERKMAYSVAVNRLDSQSNMLNTMMGSSGSSFNVFDIASTQNTARLYSIQSGGDTGSLYNAMSGNALNFTI